jgi:hypothetical protein
MHEGIVDLVSRAILKKYLKYKKKYLSLQNKLN